MILAGSDVTDIEAALKRIIAIEDAMQSSGAQDPASFTPYGYAKKTRAVSTTQDNAVSQSCAVAKQQSSSEEHHYREENICWVDNALDMIPCDEEGQFAEEEMMLILQASVSNPRDKGGNGASGPCYFCKLQGHGWRRCFKLHNLLQQNGMKGNGPFRRDTRDFSQKRNDRKQSSN